MVIDGIEIEVKRKNIKNLNLRINPPAGDVVISAPLHTSEEKIYEFASSRVEWIKKNRKKYEGYVEPKLLTGETVYLWGKPYSLLLKPGLDFNKVSGENIVIYTPLRETTLEERQFLMEDFYRVEMMLKTAKIAPFWERRLEVHVNKWNFRSMKSRWGSCIPGKGHISLALELAQKPECCLEYIIVHELCHMLVANHGPEFKALMDEVYPEWRQIEKMLNGG